MSHQMTSAVLACFYAGGGLRMLAFAVADACPDATGERMFRSVPTLAHMTQTSERSVQRGLASLVAAGWLELAGSPTGGRGRSTMYRINPVWLTDVAVEQARARLAGELPKPVNPPAPGVQIDQNLKGDSLSPFSSRQSVDKAVDNTLKGDNLSPFAKPERVTNSHLKGDKSALKGDTAMSPEHYEQNTTIPNTPLPPKRGDACGFEKFIETFPKRKGEVRAKRQWERLNPSPELQQTILVAVQAQAAGEAWQREKGRFIPMPSSWLAGERWRDDPGEPADHATPTPAKPPAPPEPPLSPEARARNRELAGAALRQARAMLANAKLSKTGVPA